MPATRRSVVIALSAPAFLRGQGRDAISGIEHAGVLIRECSIPGETRADETVPAHPNGIQISRTRWLIVYATRKFRGTDDDTSILYQVRADHPGGRLLKEGMLARSVDDWDPYGDGKFRFVKQHGHPCAFGVPKGARIGGKPAPHANVIVIKWRFTARALDRGANFLDYADKYPNLTRDTANTEWVQVRLNDREDDIEFLQRAKVFRQRGFEAGPLVGRDAKYLIQNHSQAIAMNADRTEWVDLGSDDGGIRPCLHRFNPKTGLYEFVETGPVLFSKADPKRPVIARAGSATLARWRDSWVVAAGRSWVENHRKQGERGVAWVRTEDLFGPPPEVRYAPQPATNTPLHAYTCPDGVLRLFAGERASSPNQNDRDPYFCWNIYPDAGFAASHRRAVFDTVKAGLPIRPAAMPKADMCKLLPHGGGAVQYILHRVTVQSTAQDHLHEAEGFANENPKRWLFPAINEDEKRSCAIYWARLRYRDPLAGLWDFGERS